LDHINQCAGRQAIKSLPTNKFNKIALSSASSFLIWFATCQSLTVIGRAVTFLGFSPLLKRAGRVTNRGGAAPCPANCATKRNKKGEKDEECD
jgi:hypothetical protein